MRQSSTASETTASPSRAARTRRRVRAIGLTAGLGAVALLSTGCTANEIFFLDLPDPVTKEGVTVQNLWEGSWIAAWAVGAFTWFLIIFAAIAYRRRHRSDTPKQLKYNIPIEILYTVVPLVMILGLFWFTARDQSELLALKNDQQHTVNVVAFRWNWGFNYLDEGAYSVGTPNAPAELVLPVDQKVRFELTSPDVIHSFWVPDFLFKMDVIPGKTNAFELTPDKVGTYPGRCAELCGVDHSRMLFTVRVVSQADYDAFIASLKAKGQSGSLDTGRVTNEGQMPDERTT